ncbi:C39 family peptidase [Patescibacteria group bacterium]|nr:C39 family peptidase [Patescibacteria group bacterium]MBU1673800.1 C39 family peptidase [Patescibacteria group bacterium]MBU1963827.1 C39 family peptidase [Patescibacteria group bacterium]
MSILGVGFLIAVLFVLGGCDQDNINNSRENNNGAIVETQNFASLQSANENNSEPEPEPEIIIPESHDLDIPFQPQAPFGNWDLPYQEGCEEASAILSVKYLKGEDVTAAEMDESILDMVEFQNGMFGGHYDLTAQETANMMEEYFEGIETEVIYDFEWDDIKKEIYQGHPVILPCAGQELGNPFFTPPGPVYHMLVVKGYNSEQVITNDVGTKRGADYNYDYNTLYNAVSDWETGRKAAIVVK